MSDHQIFLDRINTVLSAGEDHMLKTPDPTRCFGDKVIYCPDCGHGVDPHGVDPGGPCGVGDAQGNRCPCLMQPNGIACIALAELDAIIRGYESGRFRSDITERHPEARTVLATVEEFQVAEGWQPPAQRIETVPELDALPAESVVLVIDAAEDPENMMALVWVRESGLYWIEPGSTERVPSRDINLPVRVLWSPTEKAGTE